MLERIKEKFSGGAAAAALDGQRPEFANRISKFIYRYLNTRFQDAPEVRFLNYGYAPFDDRPIPLEPEDEPNRVFIQLYHSVVSRVDVTGRELLEISCGRGGGARYVKRYLKPARIFGLDRAGGAISFWARYCAADGISFLRGDALALPLRDQSFDAVINVEASHDYPDLPRFLAEVRRVLRPGGHFLYADFRKSRHCDSWRRQLQDSGLSLLEEEDISRQVVRGLELNTPHITAMIKKLAPWPLRTVLKQFAGVQDSIVYRAFDSGWMRYVRYVFRR